MVAIAAAPQPVTSLSKLGGSAERPACLPPTGWAFVQTPFSRAANASPWPTSRSNVQVFRLSAHRALLFASAQPTLGFTHGRRKEVDLLVRRLAIRARARGGSPETPPKRNRAWLFTWLTLGAGAASGIAAMLGGWLPQIQAQLRK